jgi:fatty acid desaturase
MKTLSQSLTDPQFAKPASYSWFERKALTLIRDERDLPFISLSLKCTFTLIPLAVLMYVVPVGNFYWWTAAVLYFIVSNFMFKGPFGLMLHCTSHRVLFKKGYGFLNNYIPWVLAPFFGHSPETYYSHHIGMHHPENNLEEDESTTMPFRRDSVRGFIAYFSKFFFFTIVNLPAYFQRKKRKKFFYKYMRGEILFYLFCIALCFVNWQATLMVFLIPLILFRLVAMLGNWAQHSFVDAQEPGNAYKNSITCINTGYNNKCWNDGYHISHHIRPSMHWTEHPSFFLKTINEYSKNDAIVFDGIHFLHVFLYLMLKRYDLLAKHFVNLDNRYSSDKEVIEFLRSRTRPIRQVHSPVLMAS